MKKPWRPVLIVAFVACVVLSVWLFDRPVPGITQRNFDRIHLGMAKEQVEAILGGPGEQVETGDVMLQFLGAEIVYVWPNNDHRRVFVCYDEQGLVIHNFSPDWPRDGLFDRWCRWLLGR